MAYTDTSSLQKRMDALLSGGGGGSYASGLAQGIRALSAGKLSKRIEAAEKQNQANRSQELAALLRNVENPGLPGPTFGPARENFTDPTVQELAAKLRLEKATRANPEMTDDIKEFLYSQKNPAFENWVNRGKSPESTSLYQVLGQDNVPVYVNRSSSGALTTLSGQPYTLNPNDRITSIGSPQGALSDVLPVSREMDLRGNEAAVKTFNNTVGRIAELVTQNPDLNTAVATGAGIVSGLLQEASAAATALGIPKSVIDPASYQATFREMGVEDAALQSLIVSAAFQAAQASGQSGKDISNRDVERFVKQIGANRSDPTAFLRALQETAIGVNDQFKTLYESTKQQPYQGELGMPQLGEQAIKEVTSQAEYDALPSGAIYLEDGRKFRKP